MLSSKPTDSSSTTTKPTKTLSVPSHVREESKTPETETIAESKQTEVASKTANKSRSTPTRSAKPRSSPLSQRAQRIKQSLREKHEVSAVILQPDGTAEEIKYNGSSKQANMILGGRPSIIGEYEELNCIVVRSLNQSQGELNKTILPVPFCNKQFNGPYLLYKVDQNGNPSDLRLEQFTKFQEKNKGLTESARKNFNPVDDQQIKPKSSFSSSSKLTLVYLRSEVDKKIRAEHIKKTGKKPKTEDIEDEVNEALQQLVDELVSSSSPMNDPDYNPDEEAEKKYPEATNDIIRSLKKVYAEETGTEIDNKQLLSALENTKTLLATETNPDFSDERDWRLQLNDALNYVRERGRMDGRILAEKISETFYELNGVEPSLDELVDVFRRIKQGLADEAEEEMAELMQQEMTTTTTLKSRSRDAMDNGSAYFLAQKLSNDFSNADPADIVDYAFRVVKEDLMSRGKSLFLSTKGRNPSKQELKEVVESLALKLAKEALDSSVDVMEQQQATLAYDEETVDEDYDPENATDRKLARDDRLEDEQFDADYFNLRMLTTDRIKSKLGNAETYDVYFCKFSKKREARNLEKAIITFKLRNKREPNALEIEKIKQFISTKPATNLIEFKLSVVGDEDVHENEEKSEVLLHKKPMMNMNKAKKSGPTTPSKVLVTPVKSKKSGKRYNVYFGDNTDQKKNEQQALKWFKRFNHREPNDLELAGIKQFVAADKSELTAVEYEVPVDLQNLNFDNEDRKETEEDDKMVIKKTLRFNEKSVVKKANKATKYTLNFDNEDERENGDQQQAMKWFKRFNNRSPNDDEVDKIKQFIKADNNDTIDID